MVHAIEAQTETAHPFAVEAYVRTGLHGHTDATEAVNRRAVRRILSAAHLRGADAARVDARWIGVLNPPIGAAGIRYIVESRGRSGEHKPQDHSRRERRNTNTSDCRHCPYYTD